MGMPGSQIVNRYGVDFKIAAVRLSQSPGVLVEDVAESLRIHPYMLTKSRKQVREGVLLSDTEPELDTESQAELQRLRDVERKYKRLQTEHDLRFASDRKRKSSASSKQTGKPKASK